MARVLFWLVHLTWGLPQTLVGAVIAFRFRRSRHEWFHGALVTHWPSLRGLSMGPFIFAREDRGDGSERRQVVHEFGHCIQSLISGPFYLLIFAIPSLMWAGIGALARWREEHGISYYSFFTERLANYFGERSTGEESPGQRLP